MKFILSKWKSNYLVALLFAVCVCDIYPQSSSSIEVKIISNSDLQSILDEAKGSPLFINVWATWCQPCREEFPDLVKLSNDYKKKVKFIGISADDVEDLKTKVIPFLEEQNADFQNYLIKVSEPEDFINALNMNWVGAIPATFIYDKGGNQKEMLVGMHTFEKFENSLKKVID